jgi:uncharacterized protein
MINIGKINLLKVDSKTELGYMLISENQKIVLLPFNEIDRELEQGESVEVFIYKDNEGFLVATTKSPTIQLHEFNLLDVNEITPIGAFLDWGISKDLFVPFAEQEERMEEDHAYIVYLYVDDQTDRLVASSGIKHFLTYENVDVKEGDQVDILLYNKSELGIDVIVNNKYKGLIFNSDIHQKLAYGDRLVGYVKKVRPDGKMDISLSPLGYDKSIDINISTIMKALEYHNGFLKLTDKSEAQEIAETLGMSKKAFKKAIGSLYKQKKISLEAEGIKLI